jgi:hypothetical protein
MTLADARSLLSFNATTPQPTTLRQHGLNLSCFGFAEVSEYRAYVIGEDGHIATVWAKQLVDGHDVELWSGDRFVIRIDHKPEQGRIS